MSEWRPINTFPKPQFTRGLWHTEPVLLSNGEDVWAAVMWGRGDDGYFQCHGASGPECEDDFENPTHWMPLPKPPENNL